MRISDGITTLRRLRPDDQAIFASYRKDPDVARFQSWPVMTDEETAGMLAHMHSVTPLMRAGHWSQIAVADTATDQLMGDMGLFLAADRSEAEIGITLQTASQGLGHANRAMQLAMRYLFETTRIRRIIVGADMRNAPSLALIRRLPFVETGTVETDGITEIEFESLRPRG